MTALVLHAGFLEPGDELLEGMELVAAIVRWWRRRLCILCWRWSGADLLCHRHAGQDWFRVDWTGDLTRHWEPTAEFAGAFWLPAHNGSTGGAT